MYLGSKWSERLEDHLDDALEDVRAGFFIWLLTQRIERCYMLSLWDLRGFLHVYIVPSKVEQVGATT